MRMTRRGKHLLVLALALSIAGVLLISVADAGIMGWLLQGIALIMIALSPSAGKSETGA